MDKNGWKKIYIKEWKFPKTGPYPKVTYQDEKGTYYYAEEGLTTRSFQNGIKKALQAIQNKLDKLGIKLQNGYTLKTASAVQAVGADLGKELTSSEADQLAQAVRDGAWDDQDVKNHIQRSNYKKKPYEQKASPGPGSMAGMFSRPGLPDGLVGGGRRWR